jgi:hypothetical protein
MKCPGGNTSTASTASRFTPDARSHIAGGLCHFLIAGCARLLMRGPFTEKSSPLLIICLPLPVLPRWVMKIQIYQAAAQFYHVQYGIMRIAN